MLRNKKLQDRRDPRVEVPPLHIPKGLAEAEIPNDIEREEVEPLGQINGLPLGAVLFEAAEEIVDVVADERLLALHALRENAEASRWRWCVWDSVSGRDDAQATSATKPGCLRFSGWPGLRCP